uniref:RRM domain-containing protein n=1 Tax=Pyramimonas obovata TaxID=1411642 RepID=A0A7S0RLP4_9CHLO
MRDLFNGALGAMDPDALANPPVVNLALDPSGKFCFAEFRTEELATLALHLDKVELCGRQIKVGRPRWYVDPSTPQYTALMTAVTAAANGNPSLLPSALNPQMPNAASILGGLGGAAGAAPVVPNLAALMPGGAQAGALVPATAAAAAAATAANPGAGIAQLLATTQQTAASTVLYLENLVSCKDLVSEEERSDLADDVKTECSKRGEVVSIHIPVPPAESAERGDPGRVYVQFQEQAGAIAAQRALHGRIFSGNKVMATFVPEEDYQKAQAGEWLSAPPAPQSAEGVIKMRGLPFTATKQDIVVFFTGFGLEESGVKLVLGRDGRPTGEAYVYFEGPSADMRSALNKHRQILGSRYVELFPSSKDEVNQYLSAGVIML